MNFNEIYELNKQNVKSIVRLITKQDNEDIEQEVYIKAWKNANKYQERGSFKSWINTIARNVSKDYLKSAGFKNSSVTTSDDLVLENIKDRKNSPEHSALLSERQKIIVDAIEALKPKLRETIMLCEIEGYTYEEAASKLKCPVGTIKSRIFNAKKELAEKLQDLL